MVMGPMSVDKLERTKYSFKQYGDWLEGAWGGDTRELRKGRFLHHQTDLHNAFLASSFWKGLPERLLDWEREYRAKTGHPLFIGDPMPELKFKTWNSFLHKTWRNNILDNSNWPDEPVIRLVSVDGPVQRWILPDVWYEASWDMIRTRIVVRYLDGVEFMVQRLLDLGKQVELDTSTVQHAQEWGYYAVHVLVPQRFTTPNLVYEADDDRLSQIEIQVTTELQRVVDELTHHYFERRRSDGDIDRSKKWQWNYQSEEFEPYFLGHRLHHLQATIMKVRNRPRVELEEEEY